MEAKIPGYEGWTKVKTLCGSIFGEVWLMGDEEGRRMVVKVSVKKYLDAKRSKSKTCTVREDPRVESQIMQMMQHHPYVGSWIDEVEDEQNHYLLMEYMDQGDLFMWVERLHHQKAVLPLDQVRVIFQSVWMALNELHSRGYAHLDVSMENVMLQSVAAADRSEEVRVCLMDFGLCRKLGDEMRMASSLNEWKDCVPPGKTQYLAPEVFEALAQVDQKGQSDIKLNGVLMDLFSLGVILYTLVVGSLPFEKANLRDNRWVYRMKHGLRALSDRLLELSGLSLRQEKDVPWDLLEILLHPDPYKRIHAYTHEWTTNNVSNKIEQ